MKIAIAGAAGNLGVLLSEFLAATDHQLTLLTHHRPLPANLRSRERIEIKSVDLESAATLRGFMADVDCVISVAGVLFRGAPEKFLPITNIQYVENLALEAARSGVRKFILLSFPHVEGETFPDSPARGIIPETDPAPIHARTRLEAERRLIEICADTMMRPLILRAGVIYGSRVKLINAAEKWIRRRALFLWRKPTWIHPLAVTDFLEITKQCVENTDVYGILNVADDHPLLLSEFLQRLASRWNCSPPMTLPDVYFTVAAKIFDSVSRIFRCAVPLNPDILRMAMMSAVCDTSRLKRELNYRLKYPTIEQGIVLC